MPTNFLRQIRETIKDENGKTLSARKLANKVGISAQALSQFELGKASLSSENINKLIDSLDISYEELMKTGIKQKNDARFSPQDKKLLVQAMDMAHNHYGDLDREKIIEIAAEIYDFLIEFKETSKNNEANKYLIDSLEAKIITGLAAKCFLDNYQLPKHNSPKEKHDSPKNK